MEIDNYHLVYLSNKINGILKTPGKQYEFRETKLVANENSHHLSYNQSGIKYCKCINGKEIDVFKTGWTTKSKLYDIMKAYLRGLIQNK